MKVQYLLTFRHQPARVTKHFSRDILSVPIDIAMGNFISIYDNMKAINNAIKEMKSLISKL